jgi:two-component system, LytTR family, response regulator
MDSIRTLLADDNQDSIEIIEYFLRDFPEFKIIGKCADGEELIEEVMLKKPDLILSDINMPKQNGLQAVRECLSFHPNLKFIFITGYNEYAVDAFRMSAIDYIVKPVEKERLYKALEKVREIFSFERNKFEEPIQAEVIKNLPLKDQNSIRYIPLSDIYFIEKTGKKCLVYTKGEIHETNETIGKILDRLDPSFFPAHRSYIINLYKVKHIMPYNESFIASFQDFDKQASISKLKINEVRERISLLHV